jgi:SAM-dependent methyltransferase
MAAQAQTTWGVGEYELIADRLEPASREIVDRARVIAADRVLDLACGTGNAALIAARRGASVTGVDFEPRLLAIAADRARDSGLGVEWVCADLTTATGAFSVVLSAFGVMYGPDQDEAAGAVARVCQPGARVVLASWAPGSFMPAMGATLGPYLPPPLGGGSPARWGDPEGARGLLAPHGVTVAETVSSSLPLSFADRGAAVAFLLATAGHVLAEESRLREEGRWDQLRTDLELLVDERDSGTSTGVTLECEYLVVLAEKAS